jgi:hypothetical protein
VGVVSISEYGDRSEAYKEVRTLCPENLLIPSFNSSALPEYVFDKGERQAKPPKPVLKRPKGKVSNMSITSKL